VQTWCLAQQLSWLTTDLGPKPPRENAAKSRCPKGTSVFRGEDSNLYQQNSEAREWFCIMLFQHIMLRYWLTNQRGKDRQRYPTNEIHDSTFNKNTSTFLRPKRYHPQLPSKSCNLNPGWGAAWGRWAFVWPPLIPDQRAPRKASRWCHDVPQGIDKSIYQCKMSNSFEGLRGCYSSEISRWDF